MKKIVKKIPARTSISYQCEICKMKYRTAKGAEKCEERMLEEKIFKIGDRVYSLVKHECVASRRPYMPKGGIIEITGPMIPNNEYGIWNEKSGRFHVFKYEVEYICPRCNKKHSAPYYANELRKTEKEQLEAIKKMQAEWRKNLKRIGKIAEMLKGVNKKFESEYEKFKEDGKKK